MKIHEVVEKVNSLSGALVKDFYKLNQEQIDKLVSEIDKMRDSIEKGTVFKDSAVAKPSKMLTSKEVEERFHISRQTIYNNIKSGKLKSYKIGGVHRFRYEDLIKLHLTQNYPKALCITNAICCDKRTDKISAFRKDMYYEIIRENKIWVYLFNEKWDGAIRMGKKQFRKNFRIKGDLEFDVNDYRI